MLLNCMKSNRTNGNKCLCVFVLFTCAVANTCAESSSWLTSFSDAAGEESPREPPCPDEEAIAPCICYTADDDPTFIVMNCSNVETEQQLQNVFLAKFPTREYQTFTMQRNEKLTTLGNVFEGTTFREVYLWQVAIEVITDDCFVASADTLESITIDGSMLNTSSFPFDTIGNYSKLVVLDVSTSRLDSVPDLESDSLVDLRINSNRIVGVLPASAFNNTPNLTYVQIFLNQIADVESGAFASLPLLKSVTLFHNFVSVLRAGTFVVSEDASIEVAANSITTVEPGAFSKVNDDSYLSITLSGNLITEIEEEVWRDLLFHNTTYLSLSSNPLVCGCDVAWLVFNPMFMRQIDNYTECDDGRLLYDLRPVEFVFC